MDIEIWMAYVIMTYASKRKDQVKDRGSASKSLIQCATSGGNKVVIFYQCVQPFAVYSVHRTLFLSDFLCACGPVPQGEARFPRQPEPQVRGAHRRPERGAGHRPPDQQSAGPELPPGAL